ncbi:SapC family protein [Rhizobium sp. RU36D]|uniref:SapC family protein n=1 Tax=Rhizobium sp. RU36D TaxID=1907415 RepID=UPI0009D8C895|nr:SapC family protein [Rhizobium sp. RU36D]SMC73647.1 SapC protein [Rhizobium sp. RU36D]
MTRENPLFYRNIVPLDRSRHKLARLESPSRPYGFAEGTQFIPAVTDEFSAACRELVILFLPGTQRLNAVFVVGLSAGQNLLVTQEGLWDGSYVPAFLRRYPFIRGDIEGADPIICIDQDFEGLNEERGEAFFTDDEQTAYLNNQVGLVNAYYEASRRSEEFCETIQSMGLLKSVTIDVRSQGAATSVHGLFSIDEEKLNALSSKEFDKLRKAGHLPAIYAQLISMGSVGRLSAKFDAARKGLDA